MPDIALGGTLHHEVGMGHIAFIHTTTEASKPMIAWREAEVVAGQGISGDRYAHHVGYYSANPNPGRHITMIEAEVIEAIARDQGIPFAPHESRRNITTRGIRLNPLVGKRLRIGAVVVDVIRLCDPCTYLERLVGQPVMRPLIEAGGIRCDVRSGGVIRVGDAIRVLE